MPLGARDDFWRPVPALGKPQRRGVRLAIGGRPPRGGGSLGLCAMVESQPLMRKPASAKRWIRDFTSPARIGSGKLGGDGEGQRDFVTIGKMQRGYRPVPSAEVSVAGVSSRRQPRPHLAKCAIRGVRWSSPWSDWARPAPAREKTWVARASKLLLD